jgi:thioesterase domain-containing protein
MVRYLYTFAQHLDPEIPFFAFQARGLDGKSAPHTSIEAMAEHYVALLLEVQPHGPYFLAGHSFGGQVAFAMAQTLMARGHEIGLLAVVDTFAPGAVSDNTEPILDDGQLLVQLVHRDMTPAREDIEGLSVEAQLTYAARRLEEANLLPEGGGTDHLRWLLNVSKANLQMLHRYKPESSLLLPITLFRACETMADQPLEPALAEDWGWSRYSSQPVPVHYVPGDHVSMMRQPHAGKLAKVLRGAIGSARCSPSPSGSPVIVGGNTDRSP